MIHVIARIQATPGNRDALAKAFYEVQPQVLAEKGCIAYDPAVDTATDLARQEPIDTDRVTMIEKWETLEDLKAHLAIDHMTAFRETNSHLIANLELHILEPA